MAKPAPAEPSWIWPLVEALSAAIDAKDATPASHGRRIAFHATEIARALGMPAEDRQALRLAALLHDIGKLAVPEHILSKPGPLTPEEFQKIRAHPEVGAAIVATAPCPWPVAPLVRCHHERWDGKGYPAGLKGEDIPLGARILSVVDYFDALMTERPYHKAMSQDVAISLLVQEAGKGLDPIVVATFVELLPSLGATAAAEDHAPVLHAAASGPRGVFEDIAQAHREIHGLYEIAQAMNASLGVADTMAIIAVKLQSLVPFACCALFLYDEEDEVLRCRFATGADARIVQQVAVRVGEGLSGWVAVNRRALVNARPSADLEASGLTASTTSLQSALVSPLVLGDRFIGAMAVYHQEESAYNDDHRRLLDRVSEQAAAVIHHAILYEQLKEDSLTDPETGLPNARFLFMHLSRELARAERLKSEVSLIRLHLDDLKAINDTFGWDAGNRALLEVAKLLRAAIRPYDICARHDLGAWFILVLSNCGAEEAAHRRLDLQEALAAVPFEARPGHPARLWLSAGIAVFPHDGTTYQALMLAADRRTSPKVH